MVGKLPGRVMHCMQLNSHEQKEDQNSSLVPVHTHKHTEAHFNGWSYGIINLPTLLLSGNFFRNTFTQSCKRLQI